MRPLRSLLIYALVVFAGGALLAPWLYRLVNAIAPDFRLAHSPFHRYVNRSLLVLAVVGLWPLLRSLGATTFKEVGLVSPRGQWRRFAQGLALGFVSLAVLAATIICCGGRKFDPSLTAMRLVGGLAGAAATALFVAILEEILFRGGIFGALRKIQPWPLAVLFSSMIYAIVHFMQNADPAGPIDWLTGLRLLPRMLAGFGNLNAVLPGFLNLTVVGVLLGTSYQRTGNLYFSTGLHAGWIFWLKFYGLLTVEAPGAAVWFWGTRKLVDGWLALAVLIIAWLILLRLLPRKPSTSNE
jgi:membrane protease YdiL (CAAX protease family)